MPSIAGQPAQIYVRERVSAGVALRGRSRPDKVVLFVHGAGTPAEVAFDPPIGDHSWMAYLASAGFDVFSMDTTGYGRSTRPAPMNDPCNLAEAQQAQFVPALIAAPCKPSVSGPAHEHRLRLARHRRGRSTTSATLRGVPKVSLVAWSLGGPRAGGYAAQHRRQGATHGAAAPAYNRAAAAGRAATLPPRAPRSTRSRAAEFIANWDRQVGCPAQYDPAVRDAVWAEMLASDPVGATWGTGVRRAPSTTTWGWNAAMIGGTKIPTLMIAGVHDKQVPPERVRARVRRPRRQPTRCWSTSRCSSHNAMWEKNHLLMFAASLEWLTKGAVGEQKTGVIRLGY